MTQVGGLVPRVLRDLGMEESAKAAAIAERWAEVVGPEIASHCEPTALHGSVLEATADSSAWCQALRLQSPEILAALKEAFGDAAPTGLRLRVG
jgi:predicted nucleic acid-binding Zn ribbon protein